MPRTLNAALDKNADATRAEKADGKDVLTLEGIPVEERDQLARSFVAATGLQCCFCIPGIALRAKALVDKNPSPRRAEINKALHSQLCRCTGYVKGRRPRRTTSSPPTRSAIPGPAPRTIPWPRRSRTSSASGSAAPRSERGE
jgi:xanthine dehydrogenase iron-sulfur cluster and FAD-binding subunit A